MKTLNTLVDEIAAEAYPGSTFATEIRASAVALLEQSVRKTALRALRKAVVTYRPRPQTERGAPTGTAAPKTASAAVVSGPGRA